MLRMQRRTYLNDKHPYSKITEGNHGDGNQEVNHHHGHCVGAADVLGERAGVDPGVVAQRPHEEIGDDGHDGEQPNQGNEQQRVAVAVEATVGEGVTDVAVSVDCDPCDVED